MALTIVQHAEIIDGTGRSSYQGDVAIQNGRITTIGDHLPTTGSDQVVDAHGSCLAPGFIDAHTHSDISILAAPEAIGKLSQGVTTDVIGNCGLSVFPVSDLNREHLNDLYQQYSETISWQDIDGYAREINRRKPGINILSLCGHNTLRASVCGYEQKELKQNNLCELRRKLHHCLTQGAAGLSTGLLYVPGKFADRRELEELLQELSAFTRTYTTHLRSEGTCLEEAVDEAIELCRKSGSSRLHISHLKTSGKVNWHKLDSVIRKLRDARDQDMSITADRYPYVESMTQLSIMVPAPFDDMSDAALTAFLKDDGNYLKFRDALDSLPRERWANTRLVTTTHPSYSQFSGEKFDRITEATQLPPSRICAEILRADGCGSMAAFSGMSPENLEKILALDFVCCGSDESAKPLGYQYGRSHPRGYGSLPRFINMLRESCPLEKIIHRISALPAEVFNLSRKGKIEPGYDADLVLFNPDELRDTADFKHPHTLCQGVEKVWVNGHLAYQPNDTVCDRFGTCLQI